NLTGINTAIKGRITIGGSGATAGGGDSDSDSVSPAQLDNAASGAFIRSGNSGNTGRTGNVRAHGEADSLANSGAISKADSTSGITGDAHNTVRAREFGGNGGRGGDGNTATAGNGGTAGTGAITVSGDNAHLDAVAHG